LLVQSFVNGSRTVRTSVADLAVSDLVTDLDDLANNFVSNTKRERSVTPTSSDGVKIGSANTTSLNGNVDIMLFKLLELELTLLEVGPAGMLASCCCYRRVIMYSPLLVVVDHEALGSLWVTHGCGI
jgi:hypothetical protein